MLPIAKEGAKCLVGRQSHGSEGGGSNPPSPPYLRHQPPTLHHPFVVHQDAPVCCSSCRPPPPTHHLHHHPPQHLQRHHSSVSVSTHPAHLHQAPIHLQQHLITSSTAQPHFQHHPHLNAHLHASQSSHHLHSISGVQQQQLQQQQQPQHHFFHHPPPPHEVMRERKAGGALTKVQKLKRRISLSFGKLAISRSEDDPTQDPRSKRSISGLKINGFSDEYLDKIEPNGNIPDKECGWDRLVEHETLSRQLSVSSDSKLLDDDIREEQNIILRPKKPPRPKSEVYLCKDQRRSKRYSAFGGDSPFGRTEAYVKLDQLGEGSYATVYKGYSNLTNQVVALKEIRLQEEEGAPFTAIREASLLKQLKHNNIVTLHDIIHTRETLTFVFEYVHTDLSQYLERHSGGLHPRNVQLFLLQLLRGLAYCHRRRILHRDIKPQNLLISELGELKIADFGLARAKSVPSRTYSHEVVTLWYRPPDVLLGSTDYTTSLDLWGVGCIFVEMITGAPAFPGVRDVHDQLDKVFKVVGTPTEASYPGVSLLPQYRPHRLVLYRARRLSSAFPPLAGIPSAETLASMFLQILPSRRVSCDAALRHKYFEDLCNLTFNLDPERSIFTLPNIRLAPEINNLPAHHNRERNRRI